MKQSKRIIALLLSLVMLLSAIPMSAYAYHSNYTSPGGYDILDDPYVTPAQAASMLLDMVDAMLAKNDMTVPIDIYVGSKTLDLRSIDRATQSISDFWNWGWVDTAFSILSFGDIEKMNMTWIEQCPLRTSAGQSDLDIVLCLCRFLKDNYDRIGKIIDDSFNYGFVTTVTDLPETIHNVPGTVKAGILKTLNEDVEPPAGTTVDSLIQKMIDGLIVGKLDPETGKYDGLLPGMLGKTNINTTSVYTFITDAINAGIADIVVPVFSKLILQLAGVEFTPEYPGGDPSGAEYLDMIIGMLEEVVNQGGGTIPYTPEDLLTPLSQMTAALKYMLIGGGLDVYFYLDDTGLHITEAAVTMFDGLIRVALELIPGLGFLENTTVFKTAEEIAVMTTPECYAYLGRLLMNEFVEFADIPETCTSFRSVLTYLLIGLARDVLPEIDYDAMISAGTLNPNTDGIFIVGAALGRYYLNGLLPIDIPTGLNFEQTVGFIFNWAMGKWGAIFNTSSFLPSDTVWQKIDKIIFSIIPINWLPAEFTGSKYLIMDWLIGNVLDFDYIGLLSIVKRNVSSELNTNIVAVILNTLSRFLSGAFGNHTILPLGVPTVEAIFTKPNFRAFVQNLSYYLYDYGRSGLLDTLFPLVTQVMGIWTKETYVRKAPAGSPLVGITPLQSLLEAYTPSNLNENIAYYSPGYNFFGAEDFSELRAYFNYKQAKTEAQALIDAYEVDSETLDLPANTDAAYRITYYYNRLAMRGTLEPLQLTKQIIKANDLELIAADWTAASWADYQTAYNFAMQVRSDAILGVPGTRQSKISEARQRLFKAIKSLKTFIPFADYAQLDLYITTAEGILANLPGLPDGFTAESIQTLRNALNTAKVIDRNISYENQPTVDAFASALYDAIYGLTYILTPAIVGSPNSTTDYMGNPITPVVNIARKFVYGLSQGGFENNDIFTVGGASVAITPVSSGGVVVGRGTGTRIRLSYGGIIIATYTAVLFGDVNGDGNVDDGDSGQIVDYSNYLYNWNTNADKRFAADVNGDGNIDSTDADIVTECLNYLMTIDQRTGLPFVIWA